MCRWVRGCRFVTSSSSPKAIPLSFVHNVPVYPYLSGNSCWRSKYLARLLSLMTCDRLKSLRQGNVAYFPIVVLSPKAVGKLCKTPPIVYYFVGCDLVTTSMGASCGHLVWATTLPRMAIVSRLSAKTVHLYPSAGAIFWVSSLVIQRSFPRSTSRHVRRDELLDSLAPNRPVVSDGYSYGPGFGLSS